MALGATISHNGVDFTYHRVAFVTYDATRGAAMVEVHSYPDKATREAGAKGFRVIGRVSTELRDGQFTKHFADAHPAGPFAKRADPLLAGAYAFLKEAVRELKGAADV